LDAAQRDANSHCHIEISLQRGGFAVTNGSPINDPSALSDVLTGVSFVGGLATGLSSADASFPQPGADVKEIQKFFEGSSGVDAST
jgi:hypothetical protein